MSCCPCATYIYHSNILVPFEARIDPPKDVKDLKVHEIDSIVGRMACLFAGVASAICIVVAPIIRCIAYCKVGDKEIEEMWKQNRVCTVFAVIGAIVTSPIAQLIIAIKAIVAALIHPGLLLAPAAA